jgi:hypothetical protein
VLLTMVTAAMLRRALLRKTRQVTEPDPLHYALTEEEARTLRRVFHDRTLKARALAVRYVNAATRA